jgi:APA family basic amino acid/polyamine antiporter/fructoselysine transporter
VWLSTIQDLLGIFTFICLVRNALLFFAWFPLQKKENYKPTFRAPGGPIMAILASVPSLILAYGELQWNGLLDGSTPLFSWNPISAGILVIVSALPFYFYFRKINADIIEESERKRNELILGKDE